MTALALAMAVLLGRCGAHSTSCTDVGATSGIAFQFDDILAAHRGESLVAEACVQGTCRTLTLARKDPPGGLVVGSGVVKNASPILVTLTITNRLGAVVFDGRQTARPIKLEPNGPECPPKVWTAEVRASGTDELHQVRRSAD